MKQTESNTDSSNFLMILFAICTLGLAPYFPEPHIWGKVKWLAGGGVGMGFMDYMDFLFHGIPWFWAIYALYKYSKNKLRA